MLSAILTSAGFVISQPIAARASSIAARGVVSDAGSAEMTSLAVVVVPNGDEVSATTSTPQKGKVKKETLWLMIGLLASVAIAGLVSAIRRAKKIREDE